MTREGWMDGREGGNGATQQAYGVFEKGRGSYIHQYQKLYISRASLNKTGELLQGKQIWRGIPWSAGLPYYPKFANVP